MVLQLIWNIRWRLILNVIPLFPTGSKSIGLVPRMMEHGTYLKPPTWLGHGRGKGWSIFDTWIGWVHKWSFPLGQLLNFMNKAWSWIDMATSPLQPFTWIFRALHAIPWYDLAGHNRGHHNKTISEWRSPKINNLQIYIHVKYFWTIQSCSDLNYFGAKQG